MPSNESTMKFKADISNMKAAMQEAGRAIRLANSEFKAAVSGMDAWNKSSDGLTAKLKQLGTTLAAQNRQLAALGNEYKYVAGAQGEDSKGAQELLIKINNQRAAIARTEKQIAEYSEELEKVENAAEDTGEALEDAGKDAEKAADGFTVMKGVVADLVSEGLKMAVSALKDFAKESLDAGMAFQASMSNVKALSGASGDQLDRLSAKARELGASTKFTATQVADAFGYMALAGWDTEQMLSSIDGILNLAASSGMDLAQASDMVTDYLSAFSMEASEAGRMADMLAYAQAHSNTTATQLGEAYGNSAAGLNTAGQSMETVTAILEAMANQGRKGSEAGTALNGIMSQITQKMKDGAIQIGETTVAVQDQEGNFRDLIDILADVESATDGMGNAEKSAALSAVFNRTSLAGLNQVLTEGVDKVRGYRDELYDATGAAEDMAETMQDNLKGDLTTMDSALEGLGIAAFAYVDGPLRGVVQGVTGLISGITKILSPQKSALEDFISDVAKSNDTVQGLIDKSQEIMSGSESDAAKLEHYRDVLLDVAGAAETNEVQRFEVSQIVGELSSEIPELAAAWDAETGSLNASTEAINAWLDSYELSLKRTALIEAQKTAWEALTQAQINKAKADQAVKSSEEQIAESGAKEVSVLRDGLGAVQEHNAAMYDLTKTRQDALNVQKEADEQMQTATDEYTNTSEAVKALAEEWGVSVDELRAMGVEEEAATEATQELSEAVEGVDAETLEKLTDAAEDMRQGIEDAMEGAVSAFDEFNAGSEITAEEVIKNLDSQIEGLSDWSANMEKLGQEAGQGMSQELYDYLAEMGPESANLVQTLVDSLDAEDGSFEEISSKWGEALKLSDNADMISSYTTAAKELSDAMGGAGEEVGGKYAEGVEKTKSKAGTAGKAIADESVKKAKSDKSQMKAAGSEAGTEFANGVKSKAAQARAAGHTLGSSAKSGAGTSSAYQEGVDLAQGYINGILSKKTAVRNAGVEIGKTGDQGIKAGQKSGSPSKLTFVSGVEFTQGYIGGIVSQNGALQKGIKDMVTGAVNLLKSATLANLEATGDTAIDQFSQTLENRVDYAINRMTYENEERLADFDKTIEGIEAARDKQSASLQKASNAKQKKLQKKYDKEDDSDKRKKIKKQITAEKESVKKQIAANEKAYQKLIDAQKKMKDQYQEASQEMISEYSDAMKAYQSAAEDLIDSTISGVTDKYNDRYNDLMDKQEKLIDKMTSAGELFTVSSAGVGRVQDLKAQTKAITDYTDKLQEIKNRVSSELFDEILSYDMDEGTAFMDQLLALNEKDFDAYNAAYMQKLKTAQDAAEKLYKSDFAKVATDYQTELQKAFAGIPGQLEKIGKDAFEGFTNGLTENTDYMTAEVKTFISAMVATFKKELKIASPSKVTFGLGAFTGEGFGDGLLSMIGYLRKVAGEITDTVESPLNGLLSDVGSVRAAANVTGPSVGNTQVVNNYNLSQTNNSPRPLTALETYQARRQQIDLVKAFTGVR